jgi:amino acid transporter
LDIPETAVQATEQSAIDTPKRVLGFRDLVLFYAVTGISLRWIATAASAGPSSVVIWIGSWLFFYLPLALSVVELSSRYPNEGGLYVWSKRAFGNFSGFMSAWTYWTSNLPYFPAVLYFAASNLIYVRLHEWGHLSHDSRFYIIFSLVTLSLATFLNIIGLDVGKWLHNIGAFAMWIPAVIIVVMGAIAWHRFGSANPFTVRSMTPHISLNDMIFWSLLIFAFGGAETGSFMGGEIKNPRKTVPWAIFFAGITVAFCYIIGTLGVLVALPSGEVSNLQGLVQAVAKTVERVGYGWTLPVAAFLICLSNVSAAGAYLAAVARLPFVAGIDRFLPPAFGHLHPRWKTPCVALLTQYFIGVLFIFLGQAGTTVKGAYDVMASMTVIVYFIPYLYVFASMIKLQNEPAGPEIIRVPGGKPVAVLISIVGLIMTTFTIVISVVPQPDDPNKPLAVLKVAGGSVLLFVIGAGLYWNGKKRAAQTT